MKPKKSQPQTVAGIDIGTHSVKILEATTEDNSFVITNFALKQLDDKTHTNLTQTLKSLFEEINLNTKNLRVSLSGPNAIVRFIGMPRMSAADLKNSLKFEADKYIPFALDDVYIDSTIIAKAHSEADQMRVVLAAAKKELVDRRLALFNDLGCTISLIDINVFSILNAFVFSTAPMVKDTHTALINLGHSFSNLVILKGETPYFSRDIQLGGVDIVKSIAKETNSSDESVCNLLQSKDASALDFQNATKESFIRLTEEIKLSFGYYENLYGGSVSKAYVAGGLMYWPETKTVIEEQLGIPVEIWDPLAKFKFDLKEKSDILDKSRFHFAVAAGLVIRTDI